jgi:hypothetical protein
MIAKRLFLSTMVLGVSLSALAHKDDDDDKRRLKADPFVFVGKAGDCGPAAGSNIVTSAWLAGMGLPDGSGPRDARLGLLLSKNGATSDCSAAGAEIKGVKGTVVTPDFALGFDYRNGGHCGAGAPRFNVTYTIPGGGEDFSFVGGCSNDATPAPAPQDPLEWSRVRFQTSSPAESSPPIPAGSRIQSITIIFDEGTDIATGPRPSGDAGNPAGIGLTVLDNIFINGRVISSGRGIEPKPKERDDD